MLPHNNTRISDDRKMLIRKDDSMDYVGNAPEISRGA